MRLNSVSPVGTTRLKKLMIIQIKEILYKINFLNVCFHSRSSEIESCKIYQLNLSINIFSRIPIFLLKSWQLKHANYLQFLTKIIVINGVKHLRSKKYSKYGCTI